MSQPFVEPGFTFVDPAVHRASVVPNAADKSCVRNMLTDLLNTENQMNTNLVEILAFIKPNCSQIASLVRGVFTKNAKLTKLLKSYLELLAQEWADGKEIIKQFINQFILWFDNDCIKLFEKYSGLIDNIESIDADITGEKLSVFVRPIRNCSNYIAFINRCQVYIRNPFLADKLSLAKSQFSQVLDSYIDNSDLRQLNSIMFHNIKSFTSDVPVSSCFKLEQIVERSKKEPFFINNQPIELCLLDLSMNLGSSGPCNALAILGVERSHRSLLYPPLRMNEFTCNLANSSIVLSPINYTPKKKDSKLVITSIPDSQELLKLWHDKLSQIFPTTTNSPIQSRFDASPTVMNGLGIVVSNGSCDNIPGKSDTNNNVNYRNGPEPTQPFQPPLLVTTRKVSSSSTSSTYSSDSQYEKSLKIINKTLSLTSLCLVGDKAETVPENRVKLVKTPGTSYTPCLDKNRPVSSHAEVQNPGDSVSPTVIIQPDDINLQPIGKSLAENIALKNTEENLLQQNYKSTEQIKYRSNPDLSLSKPPTELYQLSTGSSIDISNFGKDYKPSFALGALGDLSSRNVSTTSVNSISSKKSKKFFGLFKNSSKSSINVNASNTISQSESNNVKGLSIDTSTQNEEVEDPLLTVGSTSTETLPSRSQLPSPFALPSSTSTHFFKQYTQNNSSTCLGANVNDEPALLIPIELKNKINEADDFYISASSHNAMKISKWKHNYGKWEMLTTSEELFIKIVINYDKNQGWIIGFKEIDEETDEPILLLNIQDCVFRQSSAVDIQLNGVNSITQEKTLTLIRCKNELVDEVSDNLNQAIQIINGGNLRSLKSSTSNGTISPMNSQVPSKSSTLTSISTYGDSVRLSKPFELRLEDDSKMSTTPEGPYEKLMLMKDMTVRLQKNIQSCEQINNPASWKIISMYSLSVYLITKDDANFYNIILKSQQPTLNKDYTWMIKEDEKYIILERIGKAGLLVKQDDELFMIECKGKKEFNNLIQIL
jgi:hypothetical protein